jgi:hypothetical protein
MLQKFCIFLEHSLQAIIPFALALRAIFPFALGLHAKIAALSEYITYTCNNICTESGAFLHTIIHEKTGSFATQVLFDFQKKTAPEEKKEMNGSSYLSAYRKITG